MTTTGEYAHSSIGVQLPGAPIIARLRRMLIFVGIAVFVSSSLMVGSRGGCGDGAQSEATCVMLNLRPSGFVPLLALVTIVWMLGRLAKRVETEADAVRLINRTGR